MSSMRRTNEGGLSDASSDMMDTDHDVDSTGEADDGESQLNLALEKSISGC